MQYKVGDRVQFTGSGWRDRKNKIATIEKVREKNCDTDKQYYDVKFKDGFLTYYHFEDNYSVTLINNNTMTNLTTRLKLLTKGEPAKTFIKTGITNEQDILTPEGTELFLNWLFKKNKADFNKEVATPLLEEEEKE